MYGTKKKVQKRSRNDEKRKINSSTAAPAVKRTMQGLGTPRCPSQQALAPWLPSQRPEPAHTHTHTQNKKKIKKNYSAATPLGRVGPFITNFVRKHAKKTTIGQKLPQSIKRDTWKRRKGRGSQESNYRSMREHWIDLHHLHHQQFV